MKHVMLLVDSIPYVTSEIYHHQLLDAFNKRQDVKVTFQEISSINDSTQVAKFDRIISLLRIRTLSSCCIRVGAFLNDAKLRVVDYDPWVNFIDDSQYRGCYQKISSTINVEAFYVSAKTWSDKVIQYGMPSHFVKLGMLQKYCNFTPWQNRTREIEFKGTKHSWRVVGYEKLRSAGLPITWDSAIIKPYEAFLNYLSSVKVWAHSERNAWKIDGNSIVSNALWPKCIEALSRGCFVIRDTQEEMLHYDAAMLPALLTFSDEKEAFDVYERLLSLTDYQRNAMIQETVHFINSYGYYDRIVEQLVDQ